MARVVDAAALSVCHNSLSALLDMGCCCCKKGTSPPEQQDKPRTNGNTARETNAVPLHVLTTLSGIIQGTPVISKGGDPEKSDPSSSTTPTYSRISKPASELLTTPPPHYDVLVVGSGYGGGVLASRLSRAGKRVCVLERGQERWPGEYPNTFDKLLANMQVRSALLPQAGPKDAFFDFRIEEGAYIWIGCGLGGGSLVNSGVSIRSDTRVFEMQDTARQIFA